jgi:hypothetical protein
MSPLPKVNAIDTPSGKRMEVTIDASVQWSLIELIARTTPTGHHGNAMSARASVLENGDFLITYDAELLLDADVEW